MIERITSRIVASWKSTYQDEQDMAALAYGLALTLYTLLSTCGLLLIGFLFGRLLETALIIAVFYINQSLGGGYHAGTHIKCFLIMCCGLIACLFLIRLQWHPVVLWLFLTFSIAILFRYPLHLHPSKSYLQDQSLRFIRRSRFFIVLLFLLISLLIIFSSSLASAVVFGLLASALSRLAGIKFAPC